MDVTFALTAAQVFAAVAVAYLTQRMVRAQTYPKRARVHRA